MVCFLLEIINISMIGWLLNNISKFSNLYTWCVSYSTIICKYKNSAHVSIIVENVKYIKKNWFLAKILEFFIANLVEIVY